MKRFLLAMILLVGTGATYPPQQQSALATLAASMQPGSWVELPTVGMSTALLGTGGSSNMIIPYGMNMARDPTTKCSFYLGSDHGGTPTPGPMSTYRHVKYCESTNTWSVLPTPPWAIIDATQYTDAHGYDLTTIDVAGRTIYRLPYGRQVVRAWNIDTQVWSDLPTIPEGEYIVGTIEFFPERQAIVYSSASGTIWEFSKTTQSWTNISPPTPTGLSSTWQWSTYNPILREVLLGSSTGKHWKYSAAGVWTQLSDIPSAYKTYDGSGATGTWTVDPVSGEYLGLTDPTTGRSVFRFNSALDAYTANASQLLDKKLGGQFVVVPISDLGVTMWAWAVGTGGGSTGVYVYKHATGGGSTPPPEPPPGPPPVPAPANWTSRSTAQGVVKAVGFDQPSDIAGRYGSPSGLYQSNTGTLPELDPAVRASGNNSLRITIPPNSGPDPGGSYFLNFSDDFSVQFDGGQSFFVQWRQRFSESFLANKYLPIEGAFKQIIIGTGSTGNNVGWPGIASSCSSLEVVIVGGISKPFPQMYNSCTGSSSHGPFSGPEEGFGQDIKLENARPAPYCLYSQKFTSYFPPIGNCFGYAANEWMTFQVGIILGPRVGDEFKNSRIWLWGARENQSSQLIIDWTFNLTAGAVTDNPRQKFGQLFLTPYMTNKDAAVSYPIAHVWYDELIISRNRIADPLSGPQQVNAAPILQPIPSETLQIPPDGSATASKVITAVASDDGIPGPLTYLWAGSGLTFGQPNQPATNVTAPAGNYAGTVTVSDGVLADTESFTLTVLPALPPPPTNSPPTVWISNPANNQIITVKTLTISAEAVDDVGIACLELYVNNLVVRPCVASNKISYSLNTSPYKGKPVTIRAVARDADGLMASSTVTATVKK